MDTTPPKISVQQFPKCELFRLEGNIADGGFLSRLVRENPNNIECLFFAPSSADSDYEEPEATIIGQCSANHYRDIAEHHPELNTKDTNVLLCIWKPAISMMHLFFANNLRFCLDEGALHLMEGAGFMKVLEENSPHTRILVTTPAQIFEEYPILNSSVPGIISNHMIWREFGHREEDMPYSDGY